MNPKLKCELCPKMADPKEVLVSVDGNGEITGYICKKCRSKFTKIDVDNLNIGGEE